MNAREQRKSETCTSESGCATSVDKSSSEEKKQSTENILGSIRRALGHANSSESKGPWSYEEHSAFLDGLYTYGKDWIQIAVLVRSRNAEEVERHFHSFQIQEPFLFTLRRMLDDKHLDHIISWQPDGRTFQIHNKLTCTRIALLLYFRGFFYDFEHFRQELYRFGFNLNTHNGEWFHPYFWRGFSSELKQRDSEESVCNNSLCHKTKNLMQCTGCHNVYYCCWACQESDWFHHMWVCSKGMSGDDKPSGMDKRDIKTDAGEWSVGEHNRFLEGLERYGKSWKDIASHVKTRTNCQVRDYSRIYLNKTNSYWTTIEHQRVLEGLQQYGRGHWEEIASHVGTKNNEQVSFHAKEYSNEKGMNGKPHKTVDRMEKDSPVTREVFPDKSNQTKVNAITTSESQKPSEEEIKTNFGEWSTEEHNCFLEGLEQFGISWKDIASHVKTRTAEQVRTHCWNFLKKTDCYWTNKEHQRFLEGQEQYGRGHWEEKISYVGTKNNVQASFHVKEYFEEMESKGKPRKTADGSEKDSPAAREFRNKPNQILYTCDESNAKRNRDQEDTKSQSSKKRTSMESTRQKNTEQRIVTLEKDVDKQKMQNVIFSLKPLHQKTTELQNGQEDTCSDSVITTDVHDTSCPICFEMFNDPHIIPECCHRFCKDCIEEALEYRRECPICRGRVTSRRALRRDEVFGNLMRLSEEHKVNNFAASAQLREKNDRIQCLKSRQKEDERRLEIVNKSFQRLERELEEKNNKTETFENLVRTLFDRNKVELESTAAEVTDLQIQLQQKNQRIYDLQI